MGADPLTLGLLAVSALGTVGSAVQQRRNARSARRAEQNRFAAEQRARRAQEREQALRQARERRAQLRQRRIQTARIRQAAINQGGGGSTTFSTAQAGAGSLGSRFASNVSFLNQSAALNRTASAALADASAFRTQAQNALNRTSPFSTLTQLGQLGLQAEGLGVFDKPVETQ